MSTEEDKRNGCLKEAVMSESIKKIYKTILYNCKMKLIKIADTLKISKHQKYHMFTFTNICICESSVQSGCRTTTQSFKSKKMISNRFKLLPYPPYSPDLALRDFFLCSGLKKMLAGNKFSDNE